MSSGRKRHLSPLATQDPSRQKVPRSNGRAERVALTEHQQRVPALHRVPGGDDSPVFTFGDIQGILTFSSA